MTKMNIHDEAYLGGCIYPVRMTLRSICLIGLYRFVKLLELKHAEEFEFINVKDLEQNEGI